MVLVLVGEKRAYLATVSACTLRANVVEAIENIVENDTAGGVTPQASHVDANDTSARARVCVRVCGGGQCGV